MHRPFLILILAAALLIVLGGDASALSAQSNVPAINTSRPQDGYVRSQRLGVTFISSAQMPVDENRYRNALSIGAGWNRWPLYWDDIETAPGDFNWEQYDRLVMNDLRHGLSIDAILL